MSFDLYFCWQKPERIDFGAVSNWAAAQGSFSCTETQLWYDNAETGVYCSFDFEAQPAEDPEELPPIPDGLFDTGLSFNLNFNRPSFFGREAMPLVEELAHRFGLYVVDPQVWDEGAGLHREVRASQLVSSWLEENRRAIRVFVEDPELSSPLYMPASQSDYLWRYRRSMKAMQLSCGEELFVPQLPVLRRGDSRRVRTAFVLTQGIATVIPNADWVVIGKPKNGFFRKKGDTEYGVISQVRLNELLGSHLQPFEWNDPIVRVIKPESAQRASELLQSVQFEFAQGELSGVAADGFVDVDLPAEAPSD